MKKIMFLLMLVGVIFAATRFASKNGVVHEQVPQGEQSYSTGSLQGKKVSGLYARYLGIKPQTKLGKSINVDFQKSFDAMWACKKGRCTSPVVVEASEMLIAEYNKGTTRTTHREYVQHISVVVGALNNAIDWSGIQKDFKFSDDDLALVKAMATSFDGRDMMAYILTELMPSGNGALNVAFLDFLLRNAGREYVEGIPALYDDKTSFGPYQFTEFAVFHTAKELRGASVINHAVRKDQKIPGSVIKLRGDGHHRAAFLFATYNLCRLVKSLNAKQKQVLASEWHKNKDDIFLYCATAHHNPAAARRAAKDWIKNKAKYPFEHSCNAKILEYAQKTRGNLKAL